MNMSMLENIFVAPIAEMACGDLSIINVSLLTN